MLAKDNGIFGSEDRSAIHLLLCHRIELLKFGGFPFVPIGEVAQLSSSETAETLFLCRAVRSCVEGPQP